MGTGDDDDPGRAVPSGRLSRLARFGGMAAGVAGAMAAEGARRAAAGERPSMRALLLTPANARRVADQLATMRGAAMKVGQLLSMEAGDILPPELAEILGRLRSDARPMPARQLKAVLAAEWGPDFLKRFARFDVTPLAAASIGQVHRARTRDGRELAIKVQYPGVRESIDSDVDNVAGLIRLSGLLPAGADVAPLLAEAKRQLHEEADYAREARALRAFHALLGAAPGVRVPELATDLSTPRLLAMTYLPGRAVESLADEADAATRDRVAATLVEITLRELFEFRLMQTDPNFANYRYDPDGGRVILLDFGAARALARETPLRYRALLRAGLAEDWDGVERAALEIGFIDGTERPHHRDAMLGMFRMALEPMRAAGGFDFGRTDLIGRLRDAGMALAFERELAHIPPIETLFVQRKIAGLFLLATRLRARVDLPRALARHL